MWIRIRNTGEKLLEDLKNHQPVHTQKVLIKMLGPYLARLCLKKFFIYL
jgi:hypothetical protein